MNNKKNQEPVLEMAVLGVLSLIFFIGGLYFQQSMKNESMDWQYLFFTFIFFAMVISMLFFFRKSLLLLNIEMEKRLAMQKKHLEQLNRTCEGTLRALNYALDYRDHETWGHSARAVGYAIAIGRVMHLDDKELTQLAWGGFLHDIEIGRAHV